MKLFKLFIKFFKNIFFIMFKSTTKFNEDQGMMVANGLAFKTIFAIIPVFAVFIGVFSAFPTFGTYKEQFFNFIVKIIVPTSADDAIILINKFLNNTNAIGTIGTIALIYVSIGLFISLDNQINVIWTTTKKRSFLSKFLIYWVFLTVTPIIIVGYFYYSTIIHAILQPLAKTTDIVEFYYSAISFIILEIFVFFVYFLIPNAKVHPINALITSSIVAVIWTFFRFLFNFYTKMFVMNWVIYGSIAAVLFFMFWIYVNWIILLFGVEVLCVWQNKLYIGVFQKAKNYYLFDITIIILILKELYQDFKTNGRGLSASRLSIVTFYNRKNLEEILIFMEKEGLILSRNERENIFFLRRDIESLKLSDIENVVMNRNFYKSFNSSIEFQRLYDNISKLYYNKKENINLINILQSS